MVNFSNLNLIKKILVSLIITFCIFFTFQIASAVDGWVPQNSPQVINYSEMASSADGTKLATVVYGGYIYTSSDSGVTWIQRTSAGARNWLSITSSSDGTKLAAGTNAGYIYTSTDSGVTWTEQTGSGSRNWLYITSSSDGTKLAAIIGFSGGYVYTSDDSGVTWIERTTAGSHFWRAIASSADGTKLVAVGSSILKTSTDSGATWTTQTAGGPSDWMAVASSADGTKLVAVGDTQSQASYAYVYTSIDSGVTWVERTSAGLRNWLSVASSADGTKLIAGVNGGYMYISSDSGSNWTQQTSAGSRVWASVNTSSDFTKLAASAAGNYVYTYVDTIVAATVSTDSATPVSSSTATLAGTITDVGTGGITSRGFNYGTTISYGSTSSTTGLYSAGTYTRSISSLTCNVTYHFRAFVTNPAGTSYGSDNTFIIPCPNSPTLTIQAASTIHNTYATLNGNIISTGGENATNRGFNYGLTNSYGSTISFDAGSYGTGAFTRTITFLTCDTTYHYRAYATNAGGTGYSADQTFTTGSCSEALPATVLYGIDGVTGGLDAPSLYIIDPDSGRIIADVGGIDSSIQGMAFHPTTGVLYGTTGAVDPANGTPNSLFTISKSDGQETYLGTIFDENDVPHALMDIAFRSNGTLYGWSVNNIDEIYNLYTVDITSCNGVSCLATKVGDSGLYTYEGNGLAFDSNDNLYQFGNYDYSFYTLNPNTGLVTSATSFILGNDYSINAATFDGNDTLFGATNTFGGLPASLVNINLSTREITPLGLGYSDMQNMSALAFYVSPEVTNVTSSSNNGPYGEGNTLSIQVTFSEIVTVTGTPQLTLETGEANHDAVYTVGSGTNTLTFTYTVQAGDHALDLDYASTTALTVNGGSIKDSAQNDATLTLPSPGASGSLSYNKNIELARPAAVSIASIVNSTTIPSPSTIPTTPSIPLPPPTTPSTQTCPTLGEVPPVLKLKLIHPNVKVLQQLLNCKGFTLALTGAGSPNHETTTFGTLTQKAVKAFQTARSITVDGIVGPQTREAFTR